MWPFESLSLLVAPIVGPKLGQHFLWSGGNRVVTLHCAEVSHLGTKLFIVLIHQLTKRPIPIAPSHFSTSTKLVSSFVDLTVHEEISVDEPMGMRALVG